MGYSHLIMFLNVYLYFVLAAVTSAASLMGCSSQGLMTVLSTHIIQAGKDTITKTLTLRQVRLLLEQFSQGQFVTVITFFVYF